MTDPSALVNKIPILSNKALKKPNKNNESKEPTCLSNLITNKSNMK